VDALAREAQCGDWITECQSLVCRCNLAGQQVLLAKPLTYMNLSGQAVRLLVDKYQVSVEGIIIVLDDLNLPFGKIRVRKKGSAGGHRGFDSVLRALGTLDIVRVRLGIGEDETPRDTEEFVLSEFPRSREAALAEMVFRAREAVKTLISEGVSVAMSVYNA